MSDTKKNMKINFPRGTLEEILRIMRECRENGNVECENILKEFIGKGFRGVDYKRLKKKLFGEQANGKTYLRNK